jgi:DNA-binding transcriptional ArsR family regulator
MPQQLSAMTKSIAVALDIAGRPDTDDAYALNSVRKAYSLLNGATFQDLVEAPVNPPAAGASWFDWAEAYKWEVAKCDALAEQLRRKAAETAKAKAVEGSREESNISSTQVAGNRNERRGRAERVRERILVTLSQGDCSAQELSRITKVHLRTAQRRLKDLIDAGLVDQATDNLSPLYTLKKHG